MEYRSASSCGVEREGGGEGGSQAMSHWGKGGGVRWWKDAGGSMEKGGPCGVWASGTKPSTPPHLPVLWPAASLTTCQLKKLFHMPK
jgi:hypothetical protein